MSSLSLLFLAATVILGFLTKINTGLLAIAMAVVLGKIAHVSDAAIINGFNHAIFVMLLGVTLLFQIAQKNHTLELLAQKILTHFRDHLNLMPLCIYLLSLFLAAVGPGTIPTMALMATLTVALAAEMNIPVLHLAPFGTIGACAGGLSPIAPSGIIAAFYAEAAGIASVSGPLFQGSLIAMSASALFFYFLIGWHKARNLEAINLAGLPPFSTKQRITLAGIAAVCLMALIMNINVGLASFIIAVVLILLNVADQNTVIKEMPWGTLILITGVGVLLNLVIILGGIDLLSNFLSGLMHEKTAAAIISLSGGMLSFVSSTSGVVMPTLIPTVKPMAHWLIGVSEVELVVALCNGAHAAALTPLSTGGALIMTASISMMKLDLKAQNRLFFRLFMLSVLQLALVSLMSLMGIYRLIS